MEEAAEHYLNLISKIYSDDNAVGNAASSMLNDLAVKQVHRIGPNFNSASHSCR